MKHPITRVIKDKKFAFTIKILQTNYNITAMFAGG